MRPRSLTVVVAFGLGLASFGCNRGVTLTSPSPPSGTPGITVNSSSATLFLGATETFTATLVSSTGATSAVTTGTWSTDAPAVASVTTAGVVKGLVSGGANVFVDFQGQRGSKKITVSPNYGGDWPGSYKVLTCTQSGGWVPADFCTSTFVLNSILPYEILMSHLTSISVTGQTALGGLVSSAFLATVAANGTLPITARYVSGTTTGDESWLLNITTPGKLTGTMNVTFRDSTLAGELVVTANLLDTSTPGAALASADRSGSRGALDLARAVRR